MQVIFLKDSQHGKKGEIKTVSDGLAKNLLIPKSFAIQATKENIATLERAKKAEQESQKKKQDEIDSIISKLKEVQWFTIVRKVESYKIQGTITTADISNVINDVLGLIIDKKMISIDKINVLGFHDAVIDFGHGNKTTVTILLEASKG